MKDIFKLYINNNLVDFELEPAFPVTYQQEDFSNPTIIKNSFSKTISIEGTDNNNRIFGEIYNLDREQIYKFNTFDGVYFDPSKRTPFELYKNSDLLESGYMQLTDITIKDNKITYNITLYGGLGDFFYNLMYTDDGEKRTLADLWYKVGDDKQTELDFHINKDFVKASWNKLSTNTKGNSINDLITFAPAYNGLYEDFSNNTFCINTYNSQLFTDNTITEDNTTYTTYEGYKLATTQKEFTEWEAKDLRSYMQRPCIKVSKLLDAIFDKDNNGGYKVNLDKSFFNDKNPYYGNAYMALPLLPNVVNETNDNNVVYKLSVDDGYYNNTSHIGYYNNTLRVGSSYRLAFDGNEINASSANDFQIDMSNIPVSSRFDVKLDFDLDFVAESLDNTMNNEELYLTYIKDLSSYYDFGAYTPYYRSIIVQAVMYDTENLSAPQFYSNVLNFTSPITYNGYTYTSTYDKWINYSDTNKAKYTYTNVFGRFVRQNNNKYKWVSNDGHSKFYLDIKDVPRKNKMAIAVSINLVYSRYNKLNTFLIPVNKQVFEYGDDETPHCIKGYSKIPLYDSSSLVWNSNTADVRSGSLIKKNVLLKTDFSPCDVLLDYCKIFGLYFIKDIYSKTISIMTKNNFFTGNVVDLNNRIDLSQDMKITPYLFETKYYLMKSEDNDTYFSKKYKNEYNLSYGQKRINTNYNFNNETKDVYEGTIFNNAISVTDTSPYYRTFKNEDSLICPCWLTENTKIELYNINNGEINKYEKEYSYNDWKINNVIDWNVKSGYDFFPKTCFYSMDNNSKSLTDISSTLLFFNGFQDIFDAEQSITTFFWLSDDVYPMGVLNNGEMCYLYTVSERDLAGNTIAYRYTSLPQFLRYSIDGNNIAESFDFGVPRELYIPDMNYNEDATLYNKFWKNYLTDRYDVNTRKVSCYVNLTGMKINQESMKDFYFFNNCIWVMNKIENYYPNSNKTTKVEFVKVNDINNYLNASYLYEHSSIVLPEDEVTVGYDEKVYTIDVKSAYDWTTERLLLGYSITPSSGTAGTTTVDITLAPNDFVVKPITTQFVFNAENGESSSIAITQLPSPSKAKKLSGYVYGKKTQKPYRNYKVSFTDNDENFTKEYTTITNDSGYYELWVGNDVKTSELGVWVTIYDTNGDMQYNNIIEDWDKIKYDEQKDFEF